MAQKFLSLEEAADQLGISKDRLNELREANKVTGYRDGASWKFRSEAIEKLAVDGIPAIEPSPSDLALDLDDEPLEPAAEPPAASPAAEAPAESGSDIKLADEEPLPAPTSSTPSSELSLEDEELEIGPASDLNLQAEEVDEPTVAGIDEDDSDALALDQDDSIDITTDSILLSEAELGESPGRPPSTIIGKAELDLDADLDLSPIDKGAGPASDVRLADESQLVGGDEDLGLDLPSPSGDFEGLEELEVDLEAESSRILAPEDVAKAQAAAAAAAKSKAGPKKPGSSKTAATSDLELAPIGSSPDIVTSDINLGGESGASGAGLTGLSALELDEDDDQVLGDGSDVTLSGESSGINIISPSDSGLALDEVPLDLSGSAPIGSSLDLGSSVSEDDVSLEPLAISVGPESKVGEDFQLTPLGEEGADEEKDSSQVIALDEISEETAGAPISASLGEEAMMTEGFGVALAPGAVPIAAAPTADTPFALSHVLLLGCCIMVLGLCSMMTYDLLRNIWNFDGVTKLNSTLLEVLNPFLGR